MIVLSYTVSLFQITKSQNDVNNFIIRSLLSMNQSINSTLQTPNSLSSWLTEWLTLTHSLTVSHSPSVSHSLIDGQFNSNWAWLKTLTWSLDTITQSHNHTIDHSLFLSTITLPLCHYTYFVTLVLYNDDFPIKNKVPKCQKVKSCPDCKQATKEGTSATHSHPPTHSLSLTVTHTVWSHCVGEWVSEGGAYVSTTAIICFNTAFIGIIQR